jgi:plastocyanin domain-containing protein
MNAILIVALLVGTAPGARNVEMAVTAKGFEPARIEVKKGEPLHLVVTRKTDATCAKELVIKDEGLRKELPLNQSVSFDFTPTKSGEMTYACGMGMITGVLVVQ